MEVVIDVCLVGEVKRWDVMKTKAQQSPNEYGTKNEEDEE